MKLGFSSDLDSAKRLDEIMNSYPGRDKGSIMAEECSLDVVLFLLEHEKIKVAEYVYSYDRNIQSDSEMLDIYTEVARETRWKRFAHTEIEGIRINALRQMRQKGEPSYNGEFICYQEGKICVHCGNFTLVRLLMYLADHKQVEQFYIFTYPYWTEDQTAKYYCFNLSETAIAGAEIYRNYIWDKMQKASATSVVIPEIPLLPEI